MTIVADSVASRIRSDFPFFSDNVVGDDCVYLDNAATSLRPRSVLERIHRFYTEVSANVHRGTHLPSEIATRLFEEARASLAGLVGMEPDEIVFTAGCTAGINLVASGLTLPAGAAVAVSLFEHHSNVLPWMARHPLVWFDPLTDDAGALEDLLARQRVGLVAVTACSNVSGIVPPVREYAEVAHRHGVPIVVDAGQFAPHFLHELATLDADFVAFSAHKMLGPFGIGALCARREWLERLTPPWLGGGTVEAVTLTEFRLRSGPARFEAGTPAVAEAIGFAEALTYLGSVGIEQIVSYERLLTDRLLARLAAIDDVEIVDGQWRGRRAPLASVYVPGGTITGEHLARMLFDRHKVCTRAGHHCAHPYLTARGLSATTRLSASFYNTPEDIDRACDGIEEIVRSLL